jgi:hypothetical protein
MEVACFLDRYILAILAQLVPLVFLLMRWRAPLPCVVAG